MKAVIYTRASLDATGRTKAGRRPTTLLGGGLARCGTCGGPAVLDVRLHPVGKRRPVVWDPERLLTVERKAV